MRSHSPQTRLHFYVIGNSRVDTSLDGGARIQIEMLKRWIAYDHVVHMLTTVEGYEVCQRYGLSNVNYTIISSPKKDALSLYLIYILRMFRACIWALTVNIQQTENMIVFSGSDFWPDSIPAWVLKMRFRKVKWVAGFYLFAPTPFKSSRDEEYRGGRMSFSLKNLAYYISQRVSYWLIRRYARCRPRRQT